MARFGDLEAAIMDVVWAAGVPVRVREVSEQLNRDRPLAFNTVQTVMENLYRKGWLERHKDGRAYRYVASDRPAVYCLPGRRRIVLTTGALTRLDDRELDAVLA